MPTSCARSPWPSPPKRAHRGSYDRRCAKRAADDRAPGGRRPPRARDGDWRRASSGARASSSASRDPPARAAHRRPPPRLAAAGGPGPTPSAQVTWPSALRSALCARPAASTTRQWRPCGGADGSLSRRLASRRLRSRRVPQAAVLCRACTSAVLSSSAPVFRRVPHLEHVSSSRRSVASMASELCGDSLEGTCGRSVDVERVGVGRCGSGPQAAQRGCRRRRSQGLAARTSTAKSETGPSETVPDAGRAMAAGSGLPASWPAQPRAPRCRRRPRRDR